MIKMMLYIDMLHMFLFFLLKSMALYGYDA